MSLVVPAGEPPSVMEAVGPGRGAVAELRRPPQAVRRGAAAANTMRTFIENWTAIRDSGFHLACSRGTLISPTRRSRPKAEPLGRFDLVGRPARRRYDLVARGLWQLIGRNQV